MNKRLSQILVIGNGAVGAEKQALALAEQVVRDLGLGHDSLRFVRVTARPLVHRLPAALHVSFGGFIGDLIGAFLHGLAMPPFRSAVEHLDVRHLADTRFLWGCDEEGLDFRPGLVIGSGRTTAPLVVALGRTFSGAERCRTVQIQHPRVNPRLLDLIITPRHDFEASADLPPNILTTTGTLHSVEPALDAPRQAAPRSLLLLLGGPTGRWRHSASLTAWLGGDDAVNNLILIAARCHKLERLVVAPSRRTPVGLAEHVAARVRSCRPTLEICVSQPADAAGYLSMLHDATVIEPNSFCFDGR